VSVTDFDTKVAVVVRDDLAVWQRLNVAAFLISGVVGGAEERVVGEPYEDADGQTYLPMLVQPVLIFEAGKAKLATVHARALGRGLPIAIYTAELFATGHDEANRAAVRSVPTAQLDLVGFGLRAPHKQATACCGGCGGTVSRVAAPGRPLPCGGAVLPAGAASAGLQALARASLG
jgi:hypothetical protein